MLSTNCNEMSKWNDGGMQIPHHLLPHDGRFGSGPAKIRDEALAYLASRNDLLGTSHRRPPVRELVGDVQAMLAELYAMPDGYQVVLGNGGATAFWDVAVCSLIDRRSSHAVFGEFSRKFAQEAMNASFLEEPDVVEAPAGSIVLPELTGADVMAWPHNETSTGAMAPVQRLGDGLMLVDGTSAAGGANVDLTQTDAYYFSTQKSFSGDGGMWLAFLSPAALERAEAIAQTSRWLPGILNLRAAAKQSSKQQTVNTPSVATLLLLQAQLRWMLELGGMEAIDARCRRNTSIVYDWAEQHSFARPFVENPDDRSTVVATIELDESIDSAFLISQLRDNGIVDVDPYRGVGRNQLRIAGFPSISSEDVEALVNCLNFLIERM